MKRTKHSKRRRTKYPSPLTDIQRLLIRIRLLEKKGKSDRAKKLDKQLYKLQQAQLNKRNYS